MSKKITKKQQAAIDKFNATYKETDYDRRERAASAATDYSKFS